MANTTNLNMVKPAGTDHALISVINSNMDIIDGAVGALPSGSTLQGEIDSANTAIGNIDPKRGDLNTISSDTTLIALDAGTYQVVLSSGTPVTNGYIPAQYGTLIVNDSGKNYKSYTFVSTGNAVYSRICHKGNSTWYTAWQELSRIRNDTKTGTTDSSGNLLLTSSKLNILSATCEGYVCLPFTHSTGTIVKILNTGGTFSPITSTQLTVKYFYID